MYNRYIPGSTGYTRVAVDEDEKEARPMPHNRSPKQERTGQKKRSSTGERNAWHAKAANPFSFLGGEDKNAGIAGILKSLHLEDLDSGDVLLLLIILLVFLEGDNIELVITLGLMLLLGLGDEGKTDQNE